MNARFISAIWIGLASMAVAADDAEPAKFKISTKRPDDTVEVRIEKEKTVLVVSSPTGIGQATVQRTSESWPRSVVLRLKLNGLEHFRVASGRLTLAAAVSATGGKPAIRVWQDGHEDNPLDDKSPAWPDIRILQSDGTPAGQLPLAGGYFELTLPPALFQGEPQSITLDWIDFYRN
jgi:hypothetical protein